MADLALQFGGDLMVSASGDLATLDDQALVQQRVLRRLLTNPGDYIWQLGYGAGLGQFIGQPAALSLMAGLVRAQMQREPQVIQSPPPTVSMSMADDGTVNATVSYVDAATGQTASLSFSI